MKNNREILIGILNDLGRDYGNTKLQDLPDSEFQIDGNIHSAMSFVVCSTKCLECIVIRGWLNNTVMDFTGEVLAEYDELCEIVEA